ncbi:MAG TPA: enoyl-CoA hydratase/isomerase family protein [Rubrivivax sp.]|nr:enoyl-CoA hydratase/isomerase family protein [Rubrivivax sp.]HPO19091.1 enoyl-CoA hydratase/isomerase family protein [Rubrivivax sp.]
MSEDLKIDKRGHAMWLTIDRPAARNAMNSAVIAGIRAGLEQAHRDPEVRAVVLTGAGDKAFCAGADLAKGSGSFQFDPSRPHAELADLLRYAQTTTLPLIARVNGHCLAGGMGFLGMCDMAVAAAHASFGLPEVKIGLFPAQVLAVLQHICTPRHIAELCLTGEPIDAPRAAEIGLVNHVAPAGELDAKTDWLLQRVVGKSPTALRRGKVMMRAAFGMTFEQSISYLETQIMTLALTEDAKEGRASFIEKRAPNWTGR